MLTHEVRGYDVSAVVDEVILAANVGFGSHLCVRDGIVGASVC